MRALIPRFTEAWKLCFPPSMRTPVPSTPTGALGLPKDTEEKAHRHAAMQRVSERPVLVPLSAMRQVDGCWDAIVEWPPTGTSPRDRTWRWGRALEMGIVGRDNVAINLDAIEDEAFRRATARRRKR